MVIGGIAALAAWALFEIWRAPLIEDVDMDPTDWSARYDD